MKKSSLWVSGFFFFFFSRLSVFYSHKSITGFESFHFCVCMFFSKLIGNIQESDSVSFLVFQFVFLSAV